MVCKLLMAHRHRWRADADRVGLLNREPYWVNRKARLMCHFELDRNGPCFEM
jgi:hypothetical protein